ncbi:M16 family metallopeptidase [Hephaestia sp. GCM10023244]|uniref:M16 family metallopeptidase n=1 Tax=unclassified Hephaestia TaxID=2631281 RepID=UPI0020774440|nr:pitrilysin family protein [Hephaestia sp. MAHUQ-44]MCM8730984.1 insulinase family protein [Hephaestia sp. MAHUQ-44]
MKTSLFLCGAALCALTLPATAAPVAPAQTAPAVDAAAPVSALVAQVDIPYESFTLANGLHVIVHTDRKAPIVAVSVWYDVGSKNEPQGKTGFAHLFEHLMFNGSENAPGDFFKPLKEVGAIDANGTTSFDRTNYFETVPTPALDRALFLESDRMGHLTGAITQAVLDEQRGVVQNEKRQRDNQPYGLFRYKQVEGLFPADHPYGHTTIGSMADLDAASLADVKQWFHDHYGPNNAVLVLAGDIDVATARAKVEKYFGDIPRGPQNVHPSAPIPTLPARKDEVMKDRVAATMLTRMWAVPGVTSDDMAPLDVAAGVLGGLDSSRLTDALVRKEKLAVQVGAYNQSLAQLGIFVIQVIVRPGADVAATSKRLDQIVADFLKTGPTEDEVRRVVTQQVSETIAGLESVGGFGGKAVALAQGALYANDPGAYKKDLEKLAAQTPATVRAAAAKWLARPAYALTIAPGARDAYQEATAPAKIAAETAAKADSDQQTVKGTRGALPHVGTVADLVFPTVEHAKLANGIPLVYAHREAVPITLATISFDAGMAADPAQALGTQALTLGMMDEGTTSLDATRLAEAQERLGADISTGAGADRTYVGIYTPTANLAPALDLFADVVQNPAFAPAEVERVKGQQLAAIAQEMTSPQGLAARALPPLVFGAANPYAKQQGAGDPAAVGKLTRDDLVAFQQAWLRPDKATIFVVSSAPLATVKAALDRRFGRWTMPGAPGTKDFTSPATQAAPKIVLIDRPDSPQSLIRAGELTGLKGTDDMLAYNAANDTLGGNFLSRINMDLREAKGWSYGASGTFQTLEHAAPYIINAPVQADKTGPAIAALQTELKGFLTDRGVTQAEFDRTVTGTIRELAGGFETSSDVLRAMQNIELYDRPDDYYATLAERFRALSVGQLDAAARRVLDPDRFVWVVVGDAAKVRPQLDSLGLPVEVVKAPAAPGGQ